MTRRYRIWALGLSAVALAACARPPQIDGGASQSVSGMEPAPASREQAAAVLHDPARRIASLGDAVKDRYIVVLKDGSPGPVAGDHGLRPAHVYRAVLNGFAAEIPAGRLEALKRDPRVSRVEPDFVVHAFAKPGGGGTATPPPQTIPAGIRRAQGTQSNAFIDGGTVERTWTSRVAVVDTGIDFNHSDLNVDAASSVNCATVTTCSKGGKNCTTTSGCRPGGSDDNNHGTHVSGIIGARDNGFGVVGMAPGIPLIAVKVLDSAGSGFESDVIAGLDWVTANANALGIRVVNMSLGAEDPAAALDDAVRGSITAGNLIYTIAAGNSSKDTALFTPARVLEAITVSALADSDGQPGGTGSVLRYSNSPWDWDYDDDIAYYSNFNETYVDVAAPGSLIFSTLKGNSYGRMTGTSMAAPHVAGAAALWVQNHLDAGQAYSYADFDSAVRNDGFMAAGPAEPPTSGSATGSISVLKGVLAGDYNNGENDPNTANGPTALDGGYTTKSSLREHTENLLWGRNL